jgi:hypothetical protein
MRVGLHLFVAGDATTAESTAHSHPVSQEGAKNRPMQPTSKQPGTVRNSAVVRFNEVGTDHAGVLADLVDRPESLLCEPWHSGDEDMDHLTVDHADVRVVQRLEAERQRRRLEERQFRLALEREHKAVRARLTHTQLPPCDDS